MSRLIRNRILGSFKSQSIGEDVQKVEDKSIRTISTPQSAFRKGLANRTRVVVLPNCDPTNPIDFKRHKYHCVLAFYCFSDGWPLANLREEYV